MSCGHPACRCEDESLVVENIGYCSEHCAKPGAATACTCDHEECLARQIRPLQSPPGGNPTFPDTGPASGGS